MQLYHKTIIGIFIISLILNVYWFEVVVSDVNALSTDYKRGNEFVGTDRIVPSYGEPLGETSNHQRNVTEQVIDENNNILKIKTEIIARHVNSDEIIFHAVDEYDVDRITKKHVDSNLYYSFPRNVEQTTYEFLHPLIHRPTTLIFKEAATIQNLEVYKFECAPSTNDNSKAFPQFEGRMIFVNYDCSLWVEPKTGNLLKIDIGWDNFFVEDGEYVFPTQKGVSSSTEFSILESVQLTKQELTLLTFYEKLIPIIIVSVTALVILLQFILGKLESIKNKKEYEKLKIEKMKNEFSSMITHELKTPLVPIQGYCEILKNPNATDKLTPHQLKIVNKIQKNTSSLKRLISDLLDAQKLDMGKLVFKKTTFNLTEFMERMKSDLMPMMTSKQINFTMAVDNITICTDEQRLGQVITNLVQNSVDFVPDQGKITVTAKDSGSHVLFSVKDDGVGIDQEKQKHLFDKFYQADTSLGRKHGGTGLGLSICKGLVEGLGGTINVQSTLGKGAEFFFTVKKS